MDIEKEKYEKQHENLRVVLKKIDTGFYIEVIDFTNLQYHAKNLNNEEINQLSKGLYKNYDQLFAKLKQSLEQPSKNLKIDLKSDKINHSISYDVPGVGEMTNEMKIELESKTFDESMTRLILLDQTKKIMSLESDIIALKESCSSYEKALEELSRKNDAHESSFENLVNNKLAKTEENIANSIADFDKKLKSKKRKKPAQNEKLLFLENNFLLLKLVIEKEAFEQSLQNKFGIHIDGSLKQMLEMGWKQILSMTFRSNLEKKHILSLKRSNGYICMGAINKGKNEDKIVLYGITKATNFFLKTDSESQACLRDGAYWYFNKNKSIGFSNEEKIYLNPGDIEKGKYRMSWHLTGIGGFRVGDITNLHESEDWIKILLHIDHFKL